MLDVEGALARGTITCFAAPTDIESPRNTDTWTHTHTHTTKIKNEDDDEASTPTNMG